VDPLSWLIVVITNQPRERASSVLAVGASFCQIFCLVDFTALIEFYKEFVKLIKIKGIASELILIKLNNL